MSNCETDDPYTLSIRIDDNNQFNYRIHPPGLNLPGDQTPLMENKLTELGWPNPLNNNDSRTFIEGTDMTPNQCFTDSSNTRIVDNCYINKVCQSPTGKLVDYHCNQELPYNSNDFALDIDNPVPISNFTTMPNILSSQPDFNSGNEGYVRCREGYVFKQVQHRMDNDNEYSTAKWVKDGGNIWWVRPNTSSIPIPTQNELTGECVPDKCREITIPDSHSHSYDPLVGGHLDEPITVKCNDGYIFNHDLLHQGGKVKCDYDLKQTGDNIWERNTMNWYINDDRLEALCNVFTSQDECNGVNGYPTPTYDPYDFLQTVDITRRNGLYQLEVDTLHGANGIAIGCEWSPEITDTTYPNNTITKPSQCSFRKKVDHDNMQKPICQPVYCPEKSVNNSDRSGIGAHHPLPGPRNERYDSPGECLTMDDTIINVNTLQDCVCQQHMSCNSCSSDNNCQWCGSRSSDPNITPGCYSKNTNEPICSSGSIRQDAGGSCRGQNGEKPGWQNLTREQQNVSNCENEFECRNKSTNSAIPSLAVAGSDKSYESIRTNYQINTGRQPPQGRDLCLSYNNHWLQTSGSTEASNDDMCYFKKNKVLNTPAYRVDGQGQYFPIWQQTPGGQNELATTPFYCRNKNDNVPSPTCFNNQTYNSCVTNTECEWVPNPLSNSIINWNSEASTNKYRDIIRITQPSGKQCYICPDNTIKGGSQSTGNCIRITPTPTKDNYLVIHKDNSINNSNSVKLKKLDGTDMTIDSSVQGNCAIQYIDTATFGVNNAYNINHILTQQVNGHALTSNEAINCIQPEGGLFPKQDGYKYCNPPTSDTDCNGSPFLTSPQLNTNKGNDYCLISSSCQDKRCHRPGDTGPGDELLTTQIQNLGDIYDKEDFYSLSGKGLQGGTSALKQNHCNSTFNVSEDPVTGNGIYNNKKFARCSLINEVTGGRFNKETCDLLNKQMGGSDTVHWGKFCRESGLGSNKVSMKHVCETLGNNYEWQETWDPNEFIWVGKCYDISIPTNPTLIQDSNLCENMASPSNHFYQADTSNECIVTTDSTVNDLQIKSICESWEVNNLISDNLFEYHVKPQDLLSDHNANRLGHCVVGEGRDRNIAGNMGRETELLCEHDNNEYIQEYNYSNTSFCNQSDVNFQSDRNLRWTGGELQSQNGEWVSDCSAGILSSCQVTCDPLYGGGGTYTCHYNTHSEDVCQHVQDTFGGIVDESIQRTHCEHHPNCRYTRNDPIDRSTCHSVATPGDDLIKGQAEWLGSSCYLLNNDAFSHGIYNLSLLDEIFPPLVRLIVFFMILLAFSYFLFKIGVYEKFIRLLLYLSDNATKRIFIGSSKIVYDFGYAVRNIFNKFKNIGEEVGKLSIFIVTHKKKVITFICSIATLIILYFVYKPDLTMGYTVEDIREDVEGTIDDKNKLISSKYVNIVYFILFIIFVIVVRYIVGKTKEERSKIRERVTSLIKIPV
jgi:hypothetical protein